MPTFETDAPVNRTVADKTASVGTVEFRPRHREQWQGNLDETFDPAPIPVEVKQSIDKRVSDIMRQCSGPDETFFALREWLATARKVMIHLPAILKDVILHRKGSDALADEEEIEEEEEAEDESEANSSEPKPRLESAPSNHSQHRGRRGGRRHSHRGGGGGRDYRNGRDNQNGGDRKDDN